ncbi:MAG: coproporphyrinogen dehydrogenase HemZ [Clostridiales bacterium]|nr:coproporphyrinogen dehydrogenase HemZ [Clostridiales bacterium]
MIYIYLDGHDKMNDIQTAVQIFMPNEKYKPVEGIQDEGMTVRSRLDGGSAMAELYENGVLLCSKAETVGENGVGYALKSAVYHMLKARTGQYTPWGMMTGIRPAKKINTYIDEGLTAEESVNRLIETYETTRPKAELAAKVAVAEREILKKADKDGISLYVGIPFCPSRCLYCSFTSYPLSKYSGKVDGYITALLKELRFLGEKAKGKRLDSVYIGGGTPTSLTAEQLDRLMTGMADIFDFSNILEYTVEAGRPDTITAEKLKVIKKNGADRISINPQTMNDKTLRLIGREHTVEDIKRVYAEAREAGHDNINMDLILGLPEEGEAEAAYTMEEIKKLSPENLTVHTLAVKRASRLKEKLGEYDLAKAMLMEKMLDISSKGAVDMGLSPYYMYRQKNMLGSFENVGYAKKGFESVYNVVIMEETQSIFAAGAGASTKLFDSASGRIDRIFNVKNVDEYIERIDEMIDRKRKGM